MAALRVAPLVAALSLMLGACRSRSHELRATPDPQKTTSPSPRSVTFGHAAMPVGTIVERERMVLNQADAGAAARVTWHEEVRASDGAHVTLLALSRFAIDPEPAWGAKGAPSPFAGKTYVIDAEWNVTVEVGAPLENGEGFGLLILTKRDFTAPDAFMAPDRPIAIGDDVPALASALTRFVTVSMLDGPYKVRPGSRVTLSSIRSGPGGDEAVFAAHLVLTTRPFSPPGGPPDPDALAHLTLEGTVVLRTRDAWPTLVELAGTVSGRDVDDGGGADAGASAPMHEIHRFDYR